LEATTNPRAVDISTRAAHLSKADSQVVDETLYAVLSYTDSPDHASLRGELLGAMQAGLNGPRRSENLDAVTRQPYREFPLLPQYVGENLPGLDNWHSSSRQEPTTYLTPEQQAEKTVHIENGKFRYSNEAVPEGKHIFVVTEDGRMIIGTPEENVIHHSSLAAGKPVRMAGELTLDKDGNITSVSNQSGHYRPDADTFVKFLRALREQSVPLNDASHITPVGFKSAGASFATQTQAFDIHELDRVEPNGILQPGIPPHATAEDRQQTSPTTSLFPMRPRATKQRTRGGSVEPPLSLAA
ncbi:MAG TPA: hypothetical protein VI653_21495, partial [Steroidobacteraceae bacterium]